MNRSAALLLTFVTALFLASNFCPRAEATNPCDGPEANDACKTDCRHTHEKNNGTCESCDSNGFGQCCICSGDDYVSPCRSNPIGCQCTGGLFDETVCDYDITFIHDWAAGGTCDFINHVCEFD